VTHTKLVFLRHGRTEWNELGKLQGQADVELDEVGEKQAEEAARFFADWDFEACYTSDLKRALRTAHMVAEPHGLDVVPDARLREINVGSWSGMTTAEVIRVFPGFIDFYRFCALRWDDRGMRKEHYLLKQVKAVRKGDGG